MNIMIDLETMGNGPNAAIVAIGAVLFDIERATIEDEFYTNVDLESSVQTGGIIDSGTVLWWMRQTDAARSVFQRPAKSINQALVEFSAWVKQHCGDDALIWGNGSDFDNVILTSAYRSTYLVQPWKFYNNRCYRTVKNLYPHIKMQRTGTHHNALDDAKSQAMHLIKVLRGT